MRAFRLYVPQHTCAVGILVRARTEGRVKEVQTYMFGSLVGRQPNHNPSSNPNPNPIPNSDRTYVSDHSVCGEAGIRIDDMVC